MPSFVSSNTEHRKKVSKSWNKYFFSKNIKSYTVLALIEYSTILFHGNYLHFKKPQVDIRISDSINSNSSLYAVIY